MLISFSPTSPTDYATGEHLRGVGELVSFEIESFTPETHIYSMEESINKKGKINYKLIIQEKPKPPETPEEKRSRVKSAFLTATDDEVSTELFEGEVFSGQELGDMLNAKLCSGNIYKEMQMHREVLDMFLPFLVEAYGDKLSKEQVGTLQEIQSLGTRVKTLLSHF